MPQLFRTMTALSLTLALTACAVRAYADGSNEEAGDSKGGSDEARKAQPAQEGTSAKKRSEARGPADRNNANDRRSERQFKMNEAFTFSVAGGCQYSSTIRGTIKQIRTSANDEPKFTPTLVVNAWVTCQNNTELRVTDNTLREAPMSRAELEQAIELRGSLLSEGLGKRCAYVPDFAFSDNKLASFGVSFLCPQSSGSSTADAQERSETRRASDTRHNGDMRGAAEVRNSNERNGERTSGDKKSNVQDNRGSADESQGAEDDKP